MQMSIHSENKWIARVARRKARLERALDDARRAASWHLFGGNRFFSRYAGEVARAHNWVFIVGCNNSGTSLLQTILERTGEVSTFPVEGQRYTTTLRRSDRKGFERVWTEYLDDLRLTEASDANIAPRLLHDWLGALQTPISRTILEKTPANAVRMRWLQRVFPNSYFIGLVRNGYAVTEGIMRKGKKDALRGSRHWRRVNELMLDDAQHLEHFFLLRYEDLVNNRDQTSDALGAFLGVAGCEIRTAMDGTFGFTTINGSDPQPVKDLNAAGLARLEASDIEIIRQEAGLMLDRFDYSPSVSERSEQRVA